MKTAHISSFVLITLTTAQQAGHGFQLRFWRVCSIEDLQYGSPDNVMIKDINAEMLLQLYSQDREELLAWLKPLIDEGARHLLHEVGGHRFDLWTGFASGIIPGSPFKE